MKRSIFLRRLFGLVVLLAVLSAGSAAWACPFCAAESRSLTEELELSDAAVFAKLAGTNAADMESGNARFKIVKVLAGEEVLGDRKEIETVFYGEPDVEQMFLITGIGTDYMEWATPMPLSAAAVEYIGKLPDVPESGADRLAFFQQHLEHEDTLLAQDAYEEFARAPYAAVKELAPRMSHDRLVAWIKDPSINPTRRRLYLTMLGVCGSAADLPMLEEMIVSGYEDKRPLLEPTVAGGLAMGGPLDLPTWTELVKLDERRKKLGLDALIGCYMVLRGPSGLDLIDQRLLNGKVEYQHVYSTIMALRFLAEETQIVPRERLLASVRLLLDNAEFADQVIPDLARWEDWSVLERLVEMFKSSGSNGYIRPPVVAYLEAASEQPGNIGTRAKAALVELEEIDPEGVKRARATMAFGFLGRARTVEPAGAATRPAAMEATATKTDAATAQDQPAARPAGGDGFTASAADAAAAQSTNPADIPPDPVEFDRQAAAKSVAGSRPSNEQVAAAQAVAPEAAAAAAASQPLAATPGAGVATRRVPLQTVLVIGLPVAAVVLLVCVFWLILRGGTA
jgi:hypothetical protein